MVFLFGVLFSHLGILDKDELRDDFPTTLYFSVVTWTTLGYGDYRPTVDARLFAATEAVLGYIHMGILVGLIVRMPTRGRIAEADR